MNDYESAYKYAIPSLIGVMIMAGVAAILGWPESYLWGVVTGAVLVHAGIGIAAMIAE